LTLHRYSLAALRSDYLRAGAGAACSITFLLLVDAASALVYVFLLLTGLFLIFGVRTALRHTLRVETDAEGIGASGPGGGRIDWKDLRKVTLRYFSTRRDGRNGWMQLSLWGNRRRIGVDSSIGDFSLLVAETFAAARRHDVPLSATTLSNLAALGIGPLAKEPSGAAP
jgi:hypothetical protein